METNDSCGSVLDCSSIHGLQAGTQTVSPNTKPEQDPNSLVPRLPPEILESIFQKWVPERASVSSEPPKALAEWLAVSHVCRYWRAVALACKALWTRPDFSLPKLASEMVDRSKPKLLNIDFCERNVTKRRARVLETILKHDVARIERLSIEFGWGGTSRLEEAFESFTGPAPNLHTLELSAFAWDYIPDGVLCHGAPGLKVLDLCDYYIPRDSPLLRNLTTLTWYGNGSPEVVLTGDQLLDILRMSPKLQSLSLQGILPPSIPNGVVSLPSLRDLSLDSHSYSEALVGLDLCNHIIFSEKTRLHLYIPYLSYTLTLANAIYSCLSRWFDPSSSVTNPRLLNTLRLEDDRKDLDLLVQAWYDPIPLMDLLEQERYKLTTTLTTPIYIHFEYEDNDDSWPPYPQLMTTIVQTVPFTRLETLDIRQFPSYRNALETLLRSVCWIGTLKNLLVGEVHAYRVVNVLHFGIAALDGGAESSTATMLPFPALETLVLACVDFVRDDDIPFMPSLLDALTARSKPLSKLYIRKCHQFPKDGAGLLKGIVGDVDWDGL